jgi:hypothetical protein
MQEGAGPGAADAAPALPQPRGPFTERLLERLMGEPGPLPPMPAVEGDPLASDDLHLALYTCYELHYRGFAGVHVGWEWEPALLELRARLEAAFKRGLAGWMPPAGHGEREPIPARLDRVVRSASGPSLSRFLERRASLSQFREFVIHRSAYHLKEADPHSWAIPRLSGRAKAAMVEIQADEYGGGFWQRMHSQLFRTTMQALGLDGRYGAYLDRIPAPSLATVNLMSLFGLHRRWRGAIVGHLAAIEMTSSQPNRRYGNGLRRLGFGPEATGFYDEHVEADAVHEVIAAHDLAGALAAAHPGLARDIVFGARCCLGLEARFAEHLLGCWSEERPSLRPHSGGGSGKAQDAAIA